MVNYPIGDFLIQIKNAALAKNSSIEAPLSSLIKDVASTLKRAGFLDSVKVKDKAILVRLAMAGKDPVLLGLKLVSKPGLRIYMNIKNLKKRKARAILILTTSKGAMTSKDALKSGLGGEVIAEVW